MSRIDRHIHIGFSFGVQPAEAVAGDVQLTAGDGSQHSLEDFRDVFFVDAADGRGNHFLMDEASRVALASHLIASGLSDAAREHLRGLLTNGVVVAAPQALRALGPIPRG